MGATPHGQGPCVRDPDEPRERERVPESVRRGGPVRRGVSRRKAQPIGCTSGLRVAQAAVRVRTSPAHARRVSMDLANEPTLSWGARRTAVFISLSRGSGAPYGQSPRLLPETMLRPSVPARSLRTRCVRESAGAGTAGSCRVLRKVRFAPRVCARESSSSPATRSDSRDEPSPCETSPRRRRAV